MTPSMQCQSINIVSMTLSGANGHHSNDVSMAEEAVEAQNNGFLKKTISKIWSTSSSSSLNGAQTQQQQQPPEASSASGGCVIS